MMTLLSLVLLAQRPDPDQLAARRQIEEARRVREINNILAFRVMSPSLNGVALLFEPLGTDAKGNPLPFDPDAAVLDRKSFDLYVYEDSGGLKKMTTNLKYRLMRRIQDDEKTYALTPQQSAKLKLAGTGDITRLFGRIEEKRRDFDEVRADFLNATQVLTSMKPLFHETLEGPYGENSLYAKTLATILKSR